jgi:hypothetical protein
MQGSKVVESFCLSGSFMHAVIQPGGPMRLARQQVFSGKVSAALQELVNCLANRYNAKGKRENLSACFQRGNPFSRVSRPLYKRTILCG